MRRLRQHVHRLSSMYVFSNSRLALHNVGKEVSWNPMYKNAPISNVENACKRRYIPMQCSFSTSSAGDLPKNPHFKVRKGQQPAMSLCFLGTASTQNSWKRGVASAALTYHGSSVWLFDCGEGTEERFQQSGLNLCDVTRIFISHFHGDHLYGVPGFITGVNKSEREQPRVDRMKKSSKKRKLVEVIGPKGLRDYVFHCLELSHTELVIDLLVHELHKGPSQCKADEDNFRGRNILPDADGVWRSSSWEEYEPGPLMVEITEIKHLSNMPSLGFVITEQDFPGSLSPVKLYRLISGMSRGSSTDAENNDDSKDIKAARELIARLSRKNSFVEDLKLGKTVEVEVDNKRHSIMPDQVLSPSRKGRKITILGDTCDASNIAKLAENSTVVIHEATLGYLPEYAYSREKTYEQFAAGVASRGHSTPQMAASFAAAINARTLILTHFSTRYQGPKYSFTSVMDDLPKCFRKYKQNRRLYREAPFRNFDPITYKFALQCKEIFDGDVLAARDYMVAQVHEAWEGKPAPVGNPPSERRRLSRNSPVTVPSVSFTQESTEFLELVKLHMGDEKASYSNLVREVIDTIHLQSPSLVNSSLQQYLGRHEVYLLDERPFRAILEKQSNPSDTNCASQET